MSEWVTKYAKQETSCWVGTAPRKEDACPRKVNGTWERGFFLRCRSDLIQIAGSHTGLTKPDIHPNASYWWVDNKMWHIHTKEYCYLVAKSRLTLCDPTDCSLPGSFVHGLFPGKNTGMGYHFLLQGIFLTQGSNPHLLQSGDSLQLSHSGSAQRNIIHQLKGMEYWHMLHHGWTLKMSGSMKEGRHKRSHIVWLYAYKHS